MEYTNNLLKQIIALQEENEQLKLRLSGVVDNKAKEEEHIITLELNKPVTSKLSDWPDKNEVELCDLDTCPNMKPVPDTDNLFCSKCGSHT